MNATDLKVFDSLAIVTIRGFEPEKIETDAGDFAAIDPPGSANYLVELIGLNSGLDPDVEGVLWTDYESEDWRFSVLIASDEVDDVRKTIADAGYAVESVEDVTDPQVYGDGGGTVTLLKHPDGWILID